MVVTSHCHCYTTIGNAVITKKSDNSPCHCEVASEKQTVLWTFAAKQPAVAGTDASDHPTVIARRSSVVPPHCHCDTTLGTAVITKKSDNSPCHCEVASEKQIVLWTFAAKERAVAGTDDSDVAISSRTLRLPRRYASRNDRKQTSLLTMAFVSVLDHKSSLRYQ